MTDTDIDAAPRADDLLAILHSLHARLASAVTGLAPGAGDGPSYHSWTIGQVASHLGSGADISLLRLRAALDGTPGPGAEECQPIWARWDAKPSEQQLADVVPADAAHLAAVDALSLEQRASVSIDMFGGTHDLASLLRMRLAEVAAHTWDIVVASDPSAGLAPEAVPPMVDNLAGAVGWSAKYAGEATVVDVEVAEPARRLRLTLSPDGCSLGPADDSPVQPTAGLMLPGEALVRLVYGRLDGEHTPDGVMATGVGLDTLRATFPGF